MTISNREPMSLPVSPASKRRSRRWLDKGIFWLFTPFRLFRQRTSIQMIVSYVAAVMIAIVLLQATIIGSLFWMPAAKLFEIEQITIDPYLGERARSYTQWIGTEKIASAATDQASMADHQALNSDLRRIVADDVPGFEPPQPTKISSRVSYAAIIDAGGTVIATSNPSWAAIGEKIATFPFPSMAALAGRTMKLHGTVDPATGSLYSMTIDNSRTLASYPVIGLNGTIYGALLLEGSEFEDRVGSDRVDVIRTLALTYLRQLWIFSIPALLVAIPFGVWRARSISRRLDRLAGAASALANGNLKTRVTVTRHDEIGQVAESFNEMRRHMEDTDRSRRAFISNVSHDLRTPVAIIQGTSERLLVVSDQGGTIDPASLKVIQDETTMLTRLIDDLFTMARIEEHGLKLELDAFQLAGVVQEAVTGIRNLAWTQQKVTVETLLRPDLPLVYADRARVRQIINNLLYNALRHTPEGGLIIVQAVARTGFVELSITDTGRGIPPNVLPHVFNRYYQAERGKRKAGGSGLGLTIVRQLVEAHGGTITVESVVGQGTTFRFTIPER
jgi:signal transduction histidine kinase